MTDTTLVTGVLSSVNIPSDHVNVEDASQALKAEAPKPDGFATMGLAPELLRAIKDLGFTQPTPVQIKTIPLAMQGHSAGATDARFIDLMVSSQTLSLIHI